MTTKIDSPAKFVDRFFDWGSRLLDCRKFVDLNKIFNSFLEVLLACANSCFPAGIDSLADDEDEHTQTEQNNKVLKKLVNTLFHYIREKNICIGNRLNKTENVPTKAVN